MNSFKVIPSILVIASLITGCGSSSVTTTAPLSPTRTIVMVWDGLRPDSINAVDTPNLYNLKINTCRFPAIPLNCHVSSEHWAKPVAPNG